MKQESSKKTLKALVARLKGTSESERLLHRLHAITLVEAGFSSSEASRIFGDSPRAVAYWVTRYHEGGVDALREEARSGRPSKLSQKQLHIVQLLVEDSRTQHSRITAGEISRFISSKFGITISPRHCQRILDRFLT